MKTKSVAITGGAGFIGSVLANTLKRQDYTNLSLIDNLSTGDWRRLDFDCKTSNIDISSTKISTLREILSGVDTLYHLSAVKLHNELNSFDDLVSHNMIATERIFEAAGQAGVKNIVFTSSLYVYGMPSIKLIPEDTLLVPTTTYGASKFFGENLLSIASRKYEINYSIARLFFIYGERQYANGGYKSVIIRNFERLRDGLPALINGNGEQVLDYLYIRDCVDALILLGDNPINDVVNVSSGFPLTINALIHKMGEIAGIHQVSYAESDWTHGTHRVGSNLKICDLTGWIPKTTLDEGLLRTWRSLN
jgi:UDP-glucose 4-epimerase